MMSEMQDLPDGQLPAIEPEEPRLPPPTQIQFSLPNPNLNDSNIMINNLTHQQQNKPYFQEHSLTGLAQHEQNTAANEAPPQIEPQTLRQQDNLQLQNNANQQQSNPVLKMILMLSIAGVLLLGTTGTYIGLRQANKDQNNSNGISDDQINNNTNNDNNNDNNNTKLPTLDQICSEYSYLCINMSQPIKQYTLKSISSIDQIMSFLQLSQSLLLIESTSNTTTSQKDLIIIAKNITTSIECLMHHSPNNFSLIFQKILELQINNEKEFEKYLIMTQAFNDHVYAMKRGNQLINSCLFTADNKRLLYEGSPLVQQQIPPNCTASQLLLYFIGYDSSPIALLKNLDKLNKTLASNQSSTFSNKIIAVGASMKNQKQYAPSFMEIYTSAKGDVIASNNKTIKEINAMRAYMRLINAFYSLDGLQDITPEIFGTMQLRLEKEMAKSLSRNQTSGFQNQRNQKLLNHLVREGRRVVIFAHGHGAVNANNVGFGGTTKSVFVAPLSSAMPGWANTYVTIPNDGVVAGFQKNYTYSWSNDPLPYPMSANTFAKQFNDLSMNHSLVGYLDNYQDKIISLIVSARSTVNSTNQTYGKGLISIQLSWNFTNSGWSPFPNIDLHVFQPNDMHVYYMINSSQNSLMDVVSEPYSPFEHYYTKCDILQGNYTIKINFFDGYYSYIFSQYWMFLSVIFGQEILATAIKLTNVAVQGERGNDNPKLTLCTVNVKRNSVSGNFEMKIYDTATAQ